MFDTIAKENEYNPVITYLDTVAASVAPIDLDNLSVRYFGTSNPLYDIFLKKTLIAAVARAYEPGCKQDTTLVLQGKQGVGKSSFFDIEMEWLRHNLLSPSQCDLLTEVEATVQTNLFNRDEHKEIKAQTTKEIRHALERVASEAVGAMELLGWSRKQGLKYIKEQYGKSDRAQMSIQQLVEFRDYLRTISSK